jgi:hypothetical protein
MSGVDRPRHGAEPRGLPDTDDRGTADRTPPERAAPRRSEPVGLAELHEHRAQQMQAARDKRRPGRADEPQTGESRPPAREAGDSARRRKDAPASSEQKEGARHVVQNEKRADLAASDGRSTDVRNDVRGLIEYRDRRARQLGELDRRQQAAYVERIRRVRLETVARASSDSRGGDAGSSPAPASPDRKAASRPEDPSKTRTSKDAAEEIGGRDAGAEPEPTARRAGATQDRPDYIAFDPRLKPGEIVVIGTKAPETGTEPENPRRLARVADDGRIEELPRDDEVPDNPSGEELVQPDDDGASRYERFRDKISQPEVIEELPDMAERIRRAIETKVGEPNPKGTHTGTREQPEFRPAQREGINEGSVTIGILVAYLVVDRAVRSVKARRQQTN